MRVFNRKLETSCDNNMADIIRPIEPFELTQGFGGNYELYKQFGLAGHNGWDFKTKFVDTPKGNRSIFASWFSTFHKKGDEGTGGYGKYFDVIVQLKNRYKLTYAHCLNDVSFTIKNEGEEMAISDNTGNSTASHLHLTVKQINNDGSTINNGNGYFGAIDPQIFFDELRSFKSSQQPIMDYKKMYEEEKEKHDFDNKKKDEEIEGLRDGITLKNKEIATIQTKIDNFPAELAVERQKAKEETTQHLSIDFAKKEDDYKKQIKELQEKIITPPPAIEKPLYERYRASRMAVKINALVDILRTIIKP